MGHRAGKGTWRKFPGGQYGFNRTGMFRSNPLAEAVRRQIPGVKVNVNKEAAPDKRSYRVNFDLFKKLAPDHQPLWDLEKTINELKENFIDMNFNDTDLPGIQSLSG